MATDFVRFTNICDLAKIQYFSVASKIIVLTSSCVTQEPRITFEVRHAFDVCSDVFFFLTKWNFLRSSSLCYRPYLGESIPCEQRFCMALIWRLRSRSRRLSEKFMTLFPILK